MKYQWGTIERNPLSWYNDNRSVGHPGGCDLRIMAMTFEKIFAMVDAHSKENVWQSAFL